PKRLIYEFQLDPKVELFAPAQFEVEPGTSGQKVKVALRRDYYQGKVEVKAEGLPANVTADTLTLQPGQTEGELTFKATDAAASGKSKVKLVAAGDSVAHSADSELVIPSTPFSLTAVLSTGIWTALLAAGLSLALLAVQNRYLGKPLFASGR